MSNERTTAKFMQSVLLDPKNRTRTIDQLERFTPDTKVSYARIMISVAAFLLLTVAVVFVLTRQSGGRLTYTGLPILIFYVSGALLVFLYLIPSRNESMLSSVAKLINFQLLERIRMKSTVDGAVRSFGIRKIYRDGLIKFDNDDVGYLFAVEGHLGLSTLPSVAKDVARRRQEHLVGRSATSSELLITSITKLRMDSQFEYYQKIARANATGGIQNRWRAVMAQLDESYARKHIHNNNTTIRQYMIIREIDKTQLLRAASQLEGSAFSGMLSHVSRIMTSSEVRSILGPIVLNTTERVEQ